MKIDYHLHGEFSSDSRMSYDELCIKAIENGYHEIAITEHFDCLVSEIYHYGIPSYNEYFKRIEQIKKKYPKLNILFGVELGEYHRIKNLADSILDYHKPELKIGSIHILTDGKNISVPFEEPMTPKQVEDYYQENLLLVEKCDINILGHLGIYKRYLTKQPDETALLPIIDKIFQTIIAKDIALEVNYSPLRKSYNNLIPEPSLIKRYLKLGGQLITLGSDSHTIETFDDYYLKAVEVMKKCDINQLAQKSYSSWNFYSIDKS